MFYKYRCPNCGDFETQERMLEKRLSVCPDCGSEVAQVWESMGIVWKGNFKFMRGEPEVDMDKIDAEQNAKGLKRAKGMVHTALGEPTKKYF